MKIPFSILVLLLSSVAYPQLSALNISLHNGEPFYASIDNAAPGGEAAEEFTAENLRDGKHFLDVWTSPGTGQPGSYLFSGSIILPAGFDVYAVIDESGNCVVYKKIPIRKRDYGKYNCRCDCEYCRKCIYKNKWGHDDCSRKTIGTKDFNRLKDIVASKSFDETRADIAKQAIDGNYLLSRQVKELLALFSFEGTKLDVAKYAYGKVCDKGNFFEVYDAFAFESSVTELKEFISTQR
jgi:hypothetical protein